MKILENITVYKCEHCSKKLCLSDDSTELKADKQKLAFMDWMEVATLYDENGFYIYRKELWNIEELEKIHYAEYLSL